MYEIKHIKDDSDNNNNNNSYKQINEKAINNKPEINIKTETKPKKPFQIKEKRNPKTIVSAISPTPETKQALEAEAREAILKEADDAIYARRKSSVISGTSPLNIRFWISWRRCSISLSMEED